MKTEFNYGDINFIVDSAKHEIRINGDLAAGDYAPIGGVVVDTDVETPDICQVITNIGKNPQEKIIVYGAPFAIHDPVIILADWVIPANLLVRNDLEDDYGVYKAMLEDDYKRLSNNLANLIKNLGLENIKERLKTLEDTVGILNSQLDTTLDEVQQ
jgi:hypothetical protein